MRTSFFLIVISVILFNSCANSSYDFHQTNEISGSWMLTDTLTFGFTDQELENRVLQLELEHTNDYAYENIYLAVIDSEQSKKVFSIPLVNKKGQWLGKPIKKNYRVKKSLSDFDLAAENSFKIIHQSREAALGGVVAITMGLTSVSN